MIKFWSYRTEYEKLHKKFLSSINKTLRRGQIFFGKEQVLFEKNFLKKNKIKFGASVGSGTDAIVIALKTLNIGYGDEVITVSNTAIPTISAILSVGAKPKFAEIGDDFLINPKKIEKLISKKTKAIIPVHLYGHACDMNKINKLAKKYDLFVIEDCAQAQGAKYNGRYVGGLGDIGCFSFYPTKILGAYGDGGFVTTKQIKFYSKIKRLRFYGIETLNKKNKFFNDYYANENGINSRLDEIQSTILNIKLKNVDKDIRKRREIANYYFSQLKDTNLLLPKENINCRHVYHLFTVYHPKGSFILKQLLKKNIQSRKIYPHLIHKMKAYKNLNKNSKFSLYNTEKISKGIFCLPLYPDLKIRDMKKITQELNKILNKNKL